MIPRNIPTTEKWLERILEEVAAQLQYSITCSDIEMLIMSLRHLFESIDTLYTHTFPALAQQASLGEIEQGSPGRKRLWLHLQTISHLLTMIYPLNRLISELSMLIIAALSAEEIDTTLPRNSHRTQPQHEVTKQEGWQPALACLHSRLHSWQIGKRLSFSQCFAQQTEIILPLNLLDKALDLLHDTALMLFQETLPAFYGLYKVENTETTIMLLLDIAQRADLILLQLENIIEPIELLVKYHTN